MEITSSGFKIVYELSSPCNDFSNMVFEEYEQLIKYLSQHERDGRFPFTIDRIIKVVSI